MKKLTVFLLTVLIVFSACSAGVYGAYEIKELTEYPVIMVPGYSSSELCRIDEETGEVIHVWGDAFGQALPEVEANLGGVIADMGTFLPVMLNLLQKDSVKASREFSVIWQQIPTAQAFTR